MLTRLITAIGLFTWAGLAAAASCPEDAAGDYKAGLTAMEAGRLDEAIDSLTRASDACDEPDPWQSLGEAFQSRFVASGSDDASMTPALEAYGKAFALARNAQDAAAGAKAARSIADLGLLAGDPLKAQNWLLVSTNLEPDHPDVPDLQARLDAARGELSADEIDTGLSQTRGIGMVKNLLGGSVTSKAFWDPEDESGGGAGASPVGDDSEESDGKKSSIDIPMRFYSNSTELTTETAVNVKNLARVLSAQPSTTQVILTGHADVRGDEVYNLELSRSRAEKIRELLLMESPDLEGRIQALGDGETRPIDDGDSVRSHANNRRIEVTLLQ